MEDWTVLRAEPLEPGKSWLPKVVEPGGEFNPGQGKEAEREARAVQGEERL